jgi:DNA (cytosine-5)-methyltransferase 1
VVGSPRSAQRQLGNAVPSALAERLGLEIRRQLLGDARIGSDRLVLLPARRPGAPPPETVTKVPTKYRSLVGAHEAHPGTGLGYAASIRAGGNARP